MTEKRGMEVRDNLKGAYLNLGYDHLFHFAAPHFLACPAYAELYRTGTITV